MQEDNVRGILNTLTIPHQGGLLQAKDHVMSLEVGNHAIRLILEGPPSLAEILQKLKELCEQTLKKNYPSASVMCALTIQKTENSAPPRKAMPSKMHLPGIKNIIAVASGKGGVGKSTVAVNLALTLSQLGNRVGILDADIYGPSLPKMLGLTEKPSVTADKKLIPLQKYGLACLSIGLMVPQDTAMIWRGPMVQGALQQLLKEVAWNQEGDLDFLVVDMPPGTGDAQLTMAQQVSLKGAVMVSTPQDIALIDVRKGINMFRQVAVPILGIVENMSVFVCPECGHGSHIFAHGGAKRTAHEMDIPFLGEIPIHLGLRLGSDSGTPYLQEHPFKENPKDEISQAYLKIAQGVIDQVGKEERSAPMIEVE